MRSKYRALGFSFCLLFALGASSFSARAEVQIPPGFYKMAPSSAAAKPGEIARKAKIAVLMRLLPFSVHHDSSTKKTWVEDDRRFKSPNPLRDAIDYARWYQLGEVAKAAPFPLYKCLD